MSEPQHEASEALRHLQEGNRRFVSGVPERSTAVTQVRRSELAAGQHPFAIILGCSDSRVPPEIIFDQGLGSLFVIRVAGNIATPSQIGSVEFAAVTFRTRLIVVLGHANCGAVGAALESVHSPAQSHSPNLRSIIDRIRPTVEPLAQSHPNPKALLQQAVRANIRASANQLRHQSHTLENLIQEEGLLIVGAEYSLASGTVDFFDAPTDSD